FAAECAQGRDLGFDGKTLIHPSHIEACNAIFTPPAEEVAQARKIIAAFAQPENAARGAIQLDGRMVERLHADMAKRTIAIADAMTVSRPAAYVVHRDSQRSPQQVSHYLAAVHALIGEASDGKRGAYFGRDLGSELRMWSAAERETEFDPEVALAAFDTPEVAI